MAVELVAVGEAQQVVGGLVGGAGGGAGGGDGSQCEGVQGGEGHFS